MARKEISISHAIATSQHLLTGASPVRCPQHPNGISDSLAEYARYRSMREEVRRLRTQLQHLRQSHEDLGQLELAAESVQRRHEVRERQRRVFTYRHRGHMPVMRAIALRRRFLDVAIQAVDRVLTNILASLPSIR